MTCLASSTSCTVIVVDCIIRIYIITILKYYPIEFYIITLQKEVNNIHNFESKYFSIDSLKKSNRKKTASYYKTKISKEAFINTYKKLYE